jgi:hypothetical protein
MSQFKTISVPPPNAPPFTAAINGLWDCLRERDPKPFGSDAKPSCSLDVPACWFLFHLARRRSVSVSNGG